MILQNIIDIIRGKKQLKLKFVDNEVYKWNKKNKIYKEILHKKYKSGEKIKIAFLIMYSPDNQFISLFDLMLKSPVFDPFIIINPDIYRSEENLIFNYERSKNEMLAKYGKERVLDGYLCDKKEYIDYTNKFDMMFTNNPYDPMAHDFFKINYWNKKNIPIIYISYFYMGRCHVTIDNLKMPQFSMFWRFFAENSYVKKLAKKYQVIKGNNVVVTGYPKFDQLNEIKPTKRLRKKIIIAPHHSIDRNDLFGGFLEYSDTILNLPLKYPNIDFVFRPHMLLIENLKKENFWGKQKTEEYLDNLLSNKNVIYSEEGNYYDLFVNSDALIHDCGSFTAEYLCTGHPCAFYKRKKLNFKKVFTSFGIEILKNHYICAKENDIYDFIDNVVINEQDFKKNKRELFAKEKIMTNHPKVTQKIYETIIKEIV